MTTPLIRVGHSPDPDDAFMFYALAHDKIDTGDLRVPPRTAGHRDAQPPGAAAANWKSRPSASTPTPTCSTSTPCCRAGAAWATATARWSSPRKPMTVDDLQDVKIAVPGTMTTAFLTLRLLLPGGFEYEVVPFDQIIPARGGGQVRRRAHHPRGPAHVPEPGAAPGRRSRRLVAGEDRPAAAAGRQRRPPRPGRRDRCAQISRLLKESIRYALDHRQEALELRPAIRPRHGHVAWRTSSSACTSTTGRSTTARAAAKPSRRCSTKAHRAGDHPEAGGGGVRGVGRRRTSRIDNAGPSGQMKE